MTIMNTFLEDLKYLVCCVIVKLRNGRFVHRGEKKNEKLIFKILKGGASLEYSDSPTYAIPRDQTKPH